MPTCPQRSCRMDQSYAGLLTMVPTLAVNAMFALDNLPNGSASRWVALPSTWLMFLARSGGCPGRSRSGYGTSRPVSNRTLWPLKIILDGFGGVQLQPGHVSVPHPRRRQVSRRWGKDGNEIVVVRGMRLFAGNTTSGPPIAWRAPDVGCEGDGPGFEPGSLAEFGGLTAPRPTAVDVTAHTSGASLERKSGRIVW